MVQRKNKNLFEKCVMKIARRIINQKYRLKNKNKEFTLIAQNCVGGVIYNALGLPFMSPTINMFIEDENFVKLIENLEYYMSLPAEPLTDCYVDPINPNIKYPKIKIGDIEVCALHYKNCSEAIQKWEMRRRRVNFDNVYVIGNSWNCHECPELIHRIVQCKYPSVVFTYGDFNEENCIKLDHSIWHLDERGVVRPDITSECDRFGRKYYETMFDFVEWINCQGMRK